MASPNTIARNAELAHLHVTPIRLVWSRRGRRIPRGEFAAVLASSARIRNGNLAREHAERNAGRPIPTSGGARRRAKAIRNKEAVAEMVSQQLAVEYINDARLRHGSLTLNLYRAEIGMPPVEVVAQ